MKEGVTYKRLGDIVDILNGFAFKSTNYVSQGIRIIRIANVQKGIIEDKQPVYYPIEAAQELQPYILNAGDILMSLTGNVGRVGILTEDMLPAALNQRVACIRPKDRELNPSFLFHYLNSDFFEKKCIDAARGIAQLNMSTEWLKKQSIPVPSLSTQELIVRELDSISSVISAKKQQVLELDNLAQAIFLDTFGDPISNPKGWEVKKMGEIGTIERGKGISKSDFVEDGVPCIHYGQLHTTFGPTTCRHISNIPEGMVDKPKIAHYNDVLLALTSEDVEGSCKSTAWLGDYDVIVGSDAAIFRHNQNAVYVSYYTMTKAFYNEKEKYARGFKVTHISGDNIAQIPIPLPPLSLQQAFAEKVQAIEEQKRLINQSIAEFKSLLAQRMEFHFA